MFNASAFIKEAISAIQDQAQGRTVIAVSGGVDSTVAATLGAKALGKNLVAVHVDTGYMRKNEVEKVTRLFQKTPLKYTCVDASETFFQSLTGIVDPEQKRKIIGEQFIRVFEDVARKEKAEYLIQGTIAPDWIESGDELRDVIKSHHNVGGLPQDMELTLVEPLRDLYKDEVRKVARELQLPVAEQQPFPGPGLAIRIIGEATPERTELVRDSCFIVEDEIEQAAREGKMEIPWQYFAVLLPLKTVGVQGDLRAYGYTIAVRAVQSIDAMTASYSNIPHDVLDRISIRITNEHDNINRVVYDITNKPPGTVEWE
jgi:GMP synthase (glutamine-hydrolysing)